MKYETVDLLGRRIRIVTGTKTQTVNICDDRNDLAHYEAVYRIHHKSRFVTGAEVEGCRTLTALKAKLARRGEKTTVPTIRKHLVVDAKWTRRIVPVVEAAINKVVDRFCAHPYVHRVEHSIHCDLFQELSTSPGLVRPLKIGDVKTGHVHKEWPRSLRKPAPGERRGNFDIAVLGPSKKPNSTFNANDFQMGLMVPAVAIEVGLNYGLKHLQEDTEKLKRSGVTHGYLLHLCRSETQWSDEVANHIEEVNRSKGSRGPVIRAAFAHVLDDGTRWCHAGERKIR